MQIFHAKNVYRKDEFYDLKMRRHRKNVNWRGGGRTWVTDFLSEFIFPFSLMPSVASSSRSLRPPPLFVLVTEMSEKSATLPTIIITPSSPTSLTDYHVHFVPPPPRPHLMDMLTRPFRSPPIALPITSPTSPGRKSSRRIRLLLVVAVPLFIILVHFLLHAIISATERSAPQSQSFALWLSSWWSTDSALPSGEGSIMTSTVMRTAPTALPP